VNYKNILITGGAGFVGSNLAIGLKSQHQHIAVKALDSLKRRGSELNLHRLKEHGVHFLHADIRNAEDLAFAEEVDLIIECSAEPSVLAGYGTNPLYMIQTNLVGTINCLELARVKGADFLFLSTSRVYPYDEINKIKYRETETRFLWELNQTLSGWSSAGIDIGFPLDGPKTLYGATKLASELLIMEYANLYNIQAIINRCGVVAGPWQFGKVDQGVFAYWMMAHVFKHSLTYIGYGGSGKQVRDLCHIEDLFALIDLQLNDMDKGSGKIYNIGGGNEVSLSLLECTEICREITGNKVAIESEIGARKGDVAIYITDNRRVYEDYGWQPRKDAKTILQDIYSWIRAHGDRLRQLN
jgi:CDP-paratose 2-epimerase